MNYRQLYNLDDLRIKMIDSAENIEKIIELYINHEDFLIERSYDFLFNDKLINKYKKYFILLSGQYHGDNTIKTLKKLLKDKNNIISKKYIYILFHRYGEYYNTIYFKKSRCDKIKLSLADLYLYFLHNRKNKINYYLKKVNMIYEHESDNTNFIYCGRIQSCSSCLNEEHFNYSFRTRSKILYILLKYNYLYIEEYKYLYFNYFLYFILKS